MSTLPGRLVLLGHPVAHSLSPRFQNAALRRAGIALTYEALDVRPDDLEETVRALVHERAAGNVTIPHKERVAALCDELSPVARRTGAVNTFWVHDGALVGDNTDVDGFRALLHSVGARMDAGEVALLGAGGAGAAVLAALEGQGVRVALHNRSRERAEALAARFSLSVRVAASLDDALAHASVVVNATSIGMTTDEDPAPLERIAPDAAVVDLVYRREGTGWVRRARARGHRAADGLEMLLAQGARAFERWFGIPPDEGAMREAVSR